MSESKQQVQIRQQGKLLREDGSLSQVGWSPQPMLDCNLEEAHFYRLKFMQGLRVKVWDYYGITTPTHYYSFTISDIGYMGMMFCYVLNFETLEYEEETIITPFGRGRATAPKVNAALRIKNSNCVFQPKPASGVFSVIGLILAKPDCMWMLRWRSQNSMNR